MRRKTGQLVPLERDILSAARGRQARGVEEFYGYALAKEMQAQGNKEAIVSNGTFYKALARLVDMGHLTCRWEDAAEAAAGRRIARRLYRVVEK